MGTVFKDAKTGRIIGFSKKSGAKSPSEVFIKRQSKGGGLIVSKDPKVISAVVKSPETKAAELRFQKELAAEKTRLASIQATATKQKQLAAIERSRALNMIQKETQQFFQEIGQAKQRGAKIRTLPTGEVEIIEKKQLKVGVSGPEQKSLEQFLPEREKDKLRISTDQREVTGLVNKAKKAFTEFKRDTKILGRRLQRNLKEKDPKRRAEILKAIPKGAFNQAKSIVKGFIKGVVVEPSKQNINVIKKLKRNKKLSIQDLKDIAKTSFLNKQKDKDIQNFNAVRNVALIGASFGLLASAGAIGAAVATTAAIVATPLFIVGTVKDARKRGIVPASTQAVFELGVAGVTAKAASKLVGKAFKVTPKNVKFARKSVNKIFKNPKQRKIARKVLNKGLKRLQLERVKPPGRKTLRRQARKEILRQLKLSPRENKAIAKLRRKEAKKTANERAIESNLEGILSGKVKLTAKSSSKLRKLLRKQIVAKRSIKPLDVSPRGVFGKKLDSVLRRIKLSRGQTEQAKKQYLRIKRKEAKKSANEKALETTLDSILRGDVKLTAKSSSKLRKLFRKEIVAKRSIKPLDVSPKVQKALTQPLLSLTKLKKGFIIKDSKGKTLIEVRKGGSVQKGASGINQQSGKRLIQLTKLKSADKVETKVLQKKAVKAKTKLQVKTIVKQVKQKQTVLRKQESLAKQLNLPVLLRITLQQKRLANTLQSALTVKLKAIEGIKLKVAAKPKVKAKVLAKIKAKAKVEARVKQKSKQIARQKIQAKIKAKVKTQVKQTQKVAQRIQQRLKQRLNQKQKRILKNLIERIIKRINEILRKKKKLSDKDKKEILEWLTKQPKIYRPSLAAVIFNITAFKIPAKITGIGLRPILIKKRKRK